MRNGWKKASLNELCSLIRRGISPRYCESEGVVVINQKCIRNQRYVPIQTRRHDTSKKSVPSDLMLKEYDILINSTGVGTLGRVAQISNCSELSTFDSHITLLRPNNNLIDPRYLGWVIREKEKFIESLGEGSTGQTELSRQKLKEITITFPSLEKQQGIVDALNALDNKIELNRQMNEALEEMARSIFKSWFIDFDPVHAKAQGRKPVGMSDEIASFFPDGFEQSHLGYIPQGWKASSLGEYINFVKGKKALLMKDSSENAPHLLIATFDGKLMEMVSIKNMVMAESDDILMVMDGGSSGRTETGFSGVVGSTIAKISTPPNLKRYIYLLLKEQEKEISSKTIGTSIPHADKGLILRLPIVLPKKEILLAFNQVINPLLEKITLNKQESFSLCQLRDTLLPKLLSGEVSVKDAEKHISQTL
jgi:type I restriction enzyme S subunit